MKTPRGFSYAGINCGIKAARKDLALVFSDAPCAAAGCFTVNAARAAPVRHAAARLPAMGLRAIVANSGNANALVGPDGEGDVVAVCAAMLAVEWSAGFRHAGGFVRGKHHIGVLVGDFTYRCRTLGLRVWELHLQTKKINEPCNEAALTEFELEHHRAALS